MKKGLSFMSHHKRFVFSSLILITVLSILFVPNIAQLVKASFASPGDSSLIHACEDNRGRLIKIATGGSCNPNETLVTWLKDISAGSGLTVTRSSEGATLSLATTNANGWNAAGETWTYASSDDPTYAFTISGDKTDKYSPGMRIKLTQTSEKYFLITKVAYSSPNTTVTVYGGTDYDLANATITNPYFSTDKAPQGFPLDPSKWTVRVTADNNTVQNSPVVGTYYNVNTNLNLDVPIGVWDFKYYVHLFYGGTPSSATIFNVTASTSNNSETDKDLTSGYESSIIQNGRTFLTKEKTISLTTKTTYYINVLLQYGSASQVGLAGDRNTRNVVEAVSAYL